MPCVSLGSDSWAVELLEELMAQAHLETALLVCSRRIRRRQVCSQADSVRFRSIGSVVADVELHSGWLVVQRSHLDS